MLLGDESRISFNACVEGTRKAEEGGWGEDAPMNSAKIV
jgi:hypothetical protein